MERAASASREMGDAARRGLEQGSPHSVLAWPASASATATAFGCPRGSQKRRPGRHRGSWFLCHLDSVGS